MSRNPPSGRSSAICISCLFVPFIFALASALFIKQSEHLEHPRHSHKDSLTKNSPILVSISHPVDRLSCRGSKMLTETMAMGTGSEWAIACEVQQRFMARLG